MGGHHPREEHLQVVKEHYGSAVGMGIWFGYWHAASGFGPVRDDAVDK